MYKNKTILDDWEIDKKFWYERAPCFIASVISPEKLLPAKDTICEYRNANSFLLSSCNDADWIWLRIKFLTTRGSNMLQNTITKNAGNAHHNAW